MERTNAYEQSRTHFPSRGKVRCHQKQAEDMVETFVITVTETLQGGGEVNIAGFGAFMAKTRKGRTGVNPQKPTEKIQIRA